MKKIMRLSAVMVCVLMLTPVFASEVKNEFEMVYVPNCIKGYDSTKNIALINFSAVCVCAWQGIESRYSDDELMEINAGASNQSKVREFMKYNENRMIMCFSWVSSNK